MDCIISKIPKKTYVVQNYDSVLYAGNSSKAAAKKMTGGSFAMVWINGKLDHFAKYDQKTKKLVKV